MKIEFIEHKGELIILFDESYKWFALTPSDAREIGQKMLDAAKALEAGEPKVVMQ